MEFIIFWMFKGFQNNLSFQDKEEANAVWQVLKSCPSVSGLRTEKRGLEKPTALDDKGYQVVKVSFTQGGKEYTYRTKKEVKARQVVVETNDGLQVVQVLWSGWKTRVEMEKVCPLSGYKFIVGEVIE